MKKKNLVASGKPDWCDDETFAEIEKKFSKDGAVLSQKEVDELIKNNDLKLKSIIKG